MDNETDGIPGSGPRRFFRRRSIVLTGLACLALLYGVFASPPDDYPVGSVARIESGSTARSASTYLSELRVVRSARVLETIIAVTGRQSAIRAGDYSLDAPENVFTIARRLVTGGYKLEPIRVTIPEGTASFDMPKLFGDRFYNLDAQTFISIAEQKEGYLFPDTYFIYPNATTGEVLALLEETFRKKIAEQEAVISASGRSLRDIVIMASIIEREALKPDDRRLISGILWKRLEIGMPLQVDAPFAYVSHKSTYELTTEDLRADMPYNTYTRAGLPPGPISNPGMDSILAALQPKKSNYLYYLSDRKGTVHYAATFEEHKKNKARYIW